MRLVEYLIEAVANRKTGKYGNGDIRIGMALNEYLDTLNSHGLLICGQYENCSETAMTKKKPCYNCYKISNGLWAKVFVEICFPDGDLFTITFAHGISDNAYLIGGPTKGDYRTGDTKKVIEMLNKRLEEI